LSNEKVIEEGCWAKEEKAIAVNYKETNEVGMTRRAKGGLFKAFERGGNRGYRGNMETEEGSSEREANG